MNLSLNFLKKYINIDGYSIEEIAHKMTMAGLEVESINRGAIIPGTIIVGEILTRNKHPNADKLSVCTVNVGSETPLQIVCGAPNCDVGKRVPVATLGTLFPSAKGDFEIKEVKLRGVQSCGMMCSSRELGLSNDHEGLLHLPPETPIGQKVADLFQSDTIFELEITSNRPDWLSHWGVARDIAAMINVTPKFPEIKVEYPTTLPPSDLVTVLDQHACPYYSARVIRNVKIAESPEWLKNTLTAIGLRPINNIVDITNFVLHELGSPLHAFDLKKLKDEKIVVRRAKDGEKLDLLDGKNLSLKSKHLVIADTEKPLVLAGVRGGINSGVTETTTDILLESAEFFSSLIRSTAREFNENTDSSYRYERGIDSQMVSIAADRATQLILEIAGGELVYAPCVVAQPIVEMKPFIVKTSHINDLLGTHISMQDMFKILNHLGVKCIEKATDVFEVTAPSYRRDLMRMADIAEEIARIYGLDNIPVLPSNAIQGGVKADDTMYPLQQLRNQIIAQGFYECYTYSMVDEKVAKHDPSVNEKEIITISNPLNLDMNYMRPSMFIQMIQNIGRNLARNNYNQKLFEIGHCFCADSKKYPEERLELALAMIGRRFPTALSSEAGLIDFFDLKGVVENLCVGRQLNYSVKPIKDARFTEGHAAEIIIRGQTIGYMGEVAHPFTKSLRLRHPLFMLILNATALLEMTSKIPQLVQLPLYPSVSRDIAFLADEKLENQTVIDFITRLKLPHFAGIKLFDLFRDEKVLGVNKKSMAYSLSFINLERTLTDEEVNVAYHYAREKLTKELGVELR